MNPKPRLNTLVLLVAGLLVVLLTSGCGFYYVDFFTEHGSGHVDEQEYAVSDFHAINFGGVGELTVEMGDEESVRIQAEDNFLDHFTVEVRDGVLEIGMRSPHLNFHATRDIRIFVTARTLDSVTLSGVGSVNVPELTGTHCDVVASGTGTLTVETLSCTELDLSLTGMGNVTVEGGQVDFQDVSITGAIDYQARDLESRVVDVHITGLGSSTIWASDSLEVFISGVGNLSYYGQPHLSKSGSGIGQVVSLGDK